eukprot:gene3242-3551_t
METNNGFARVLIFYHRYQRSKLTESDLIKIYKKYKTKPNDLLQDLSKKYSDWPIPSSVTINQLLHILHHYTIPKSYLDQIIHSVSISDYDSSYDRTIDVNSSDFNADIVFSNERMIAPDLSIPPLDNMSKVSMQMFADGKLITKPVPVSQLPAGPLKETSHPFDLMMKAATPISTFRNDMGILIEAASPLVLLKKFVEKRQRVRVMVRRRGCVRGFVDGFLKCFDRHFNLLLSDVDEAYIPNSVSLHYPYHESK